MTTDSRFSPHPKASVPSESPGTQRGQEVLDAAVRHARSLLAERLVAAYALGSLAHGGFAPAVSDVDLALILAELDDRVPSVIGLIKKEVVIELGSPLAERLSIFWSCEEELREGTCSGRLPLADLIDFKAYGVLLWGTEVRQQVLIPAEDALHRALMLEAAEFMLGKFAKTERDVWFDSPAVLLELGLREVTKAVLFPVRFLYTLERGTPTTNAEAVRWFPSGPSTEVRALVAAPFDWRERGTIPCKVEAEQMLQAGLRLLYLDLIRQFATRLREFDERLLAEKLEAWRNRLVAPSVQCRSGGPA